MDRSLPAPDREDPPAERLRYLKRVRDLGGMLAAASDRIEAEQRLPEALLSRLGEDGFFGLLLPRRFGGAELDPAGFTEVIEAVARIDASTAWCLGQAGGCAMIAAYVSPPVAREIFGPGGRGIVAWGPGPEARAVAVEGGYRVTGTWSFASGCRHATWLGGYCPVYGADGTPRGDSRTMMFPAASAVISDAWQVMGLRGTGSDAFAVTDLFVPEAYAPARDDPAHRREVGLLYRFRTTNLYAAAFAGVALGIARSMLDALIALAGRKTPRGFARPLGENPVIQSQVAVAEARLASARLYLLGTLAGIWRDAGRTGKVSLAQRMSLRLASTHAIHEARFVADTAWNGAGASAIFVGSAFERRFRDMHTLTQQVQGRQSHFETVGQFMLGLEADLTFV
jgi:alkylation response protein AidB-like acyl-CoA dehydrogenase